MDLFNQVHIFQPMKVHTFELNIRLIRLFSLMLNYAKPRLTFQVFTQGGETDQIIRKVYHVN